MWRAAPVVCSTDALVTVIRLDAAGKVINMGILGGTAASSADQKLSLEAPGIKFLKK